MAYEKDNNPDKAPGVVTKAEEAAAEAEAAANSEQAGPSSGARGNIPPPPAYEPPAYEATLSPTSPSATFPAGEPIAPTVSAPFNFPSDAALPSYESLAADVKNQKPIAIPQLHAVPTSGLVPVYPPSLLSHGITKGTWSSFIQTVSAFLTAKVSDRSVSHAGDMAKEFVKPHKKIGQDLLDHTKDVGRDIAKSAKKGNVIGAAFGAIGGVVTIPIFTALGIVGAATSLPGAAIGAIVKKPQTPGQRAAAYAAVANKKWLHPRGLHAHMLDTNELGQLLGIPVLDFLNQSQQTKDHSAAGQLQALEGHIAPLELQHGGAIMKLETNTIWLVLVPGVPEEPVKKRNGSDSESDSESDDSDDSKSSNRRESRMRRYERREQRRTRRARRGKRAA